MGTLTEDALAQSVDPFTLQTGEKVMVVTKMGSPVSTGVVQAVYSYGAVQLREIVDPRSSTGSRIYDVELYSFVLIKDDATTVDPDEFAIAVDAQSVAEEDEEDSPDESEPSPKPEKKETKASMKEAQVERVMAAISEAAMQSMRSSGVPHTEIYKRVVALQGAILPILKSPEV